MRTTFINELVAAARVNPKIFLIVGDLGAGVVEPFMREFPDRFLNAGVAEQNMTGVAAGLASEGFHVFTYSIANFPTLRCLEQIRNDVCYHKLPVTIVSVGAGLSYGNFGYSHHAVQDVGIMRTLPGITIMSPADEGEAGACVRWLCDHPGPSYLRLDKGKASLIYRPCRIEHPQKLRGRIADIGVGVITTGSILATVLAATDLMDDCVDVYSIPCLKPLGDFSSFSGYRDLLVVEEHVRAGGLASIIQEHIDVPVTSLHVRDDLVNLVGSQDYLRDQHGISARKISDTLRRMIK